MEFFTSFYIINPVEPDLLFVLYISSFYRVLYSPLLLISFAAILFAFLIPFNSDYVVLFAPLFIFLISVPRHDDIRFML